MFQKPPKGGLPVRARFNFATMSMSALIVRAHSGCVDLQFGEQGRPSTFFVVERVPPRVRQRNSKAGSSDKG